MNKARAVILLLFSLFLVGCSWGIGNITVYGGITYTEDEEGVPIPERQTPTQEVVVPTSTPSILCRGTVVTDPAYSLRVRAAPNYGGLLPHRLPSGAIVNVISIDGDWYEIANPYGWVMGQWVECPF